MEFSSQLSSLFKRKTRGNNSPKSETISPKMKRLNESDKEHQANSPPAIVSPPKTKNDQEDSSSSPRYGRGFCLQSGLNTIQAEPTREHWHANKHIAKLG